MATILESIQSLGKQHPASPTSRSNHPPIFRTGRTDGVDTIRVRGGRRADGLRHRRQHENLNLDTGEVTRTHESSTQFISELGLRVSATDLWGGKAWYEFSVPKFNRLTNATPEPVDGVYRAINYCYTALSEIIDWEGTIHDLEVRRIDYVVDFDGVHDIPRFLDALHVNPRAGGKVRRRYNNPHRGQAQSLSIGTPKRWSVTLYDKGKEMSWSARKIKDPIARNQHLYRADQVSRLGRLRCEVSVRAEPLKERFGSNRLDDVLDADRLQHLAKHYVDYSGLSTPVGGADKINAAVQQLHHTGDPRAKMADRMIGTLWLDAHGLPQAAHPTTLAKHRKLAKDLGLTPADILAGKGPLVRLDWETGLLVGQETAA